MGSESITADLPVEITANQEATEAAPLAEEIKNPERPVMTVKAETGRSYIIIGGYSTAENAEIRREAVREAGFASKMLLPGKSGKLYRVSVADFATPDEAKAALKNYKKSFGETIWVLNY